MATILQNTLADIRQRFNRGAEQFPFFKVAVTNLRLVHCSMIAEYLFRESISRTLRQANIACGDDDVILSGGPGYRLKDWITIHQGVQSDAVCPAGFCNREAPLGLHVAV